MALLALVPVRRMFSDAIKSATILSFYRDDVIHDGKVTAGRDIETG